MLSISLPAIRGTDTNSLHRYMDEARFLLYSADRAEREKAEMLNRRIAEELKKRASPAEGPQWHGQ